MTVKNFPRVVNHVKDIFSLNIKLVRLTVQTVFNRLIEIPYIGLSSISTERNWRRLHLPLLSYRMTVSFSYGIINSRM